MIEWEKRANGFFFLLLFSLWGVSAFAYFPFLPHMRRNVEQQAKRNGSAGSNGRPVPTIEPSIYRHTDIGNKRKKGKNEAEEWRNSKREAEGYQRSSLTK